MRGRGRRGGRLRVRVQALSGRTYAAGTAVELVGSGATVDGRVEGEWVRLRWWEFAESGEPEEAGERPKR